jgi:hypothetical protein
MHYISLLKKLHVCDWTALLVISIIATITYIIRPYGRIFFIVKSGYQTIHVCTVCVCENESIISAKDLLETDVIGYCRWCQRRGGFFNKLGFKPSIIPPRFLHARPLSLASIALLQYVQYRLP